MASQWCLLVLALLVPAVSAQVSGDGLGGLADSPAAAPLGSAATANIDVPTDLCDKEFCLQAAPAACGGNCILTPFANQSTYCATPCIGVWNSASVQTCLAGQATGVYIQRELTAIANMCNAGAIAAQRRRVAMTKYNKQFPCTATVNATTLLSLDTCPTGANATVADTCPAQCSAALLDIPAACRATFPRLVPAWNATLTACIMSSAAGPATAAGSGVGSGTSTSPGADFLAGGPSTAAPSGSGDQGALTMAGPSALLTTALAVLLAAAMLV